jgi:hypothetical protein
MTSGRPEKEVMDTASSGVITYSLYNYFILFGGQTTNHVVSDHGPWTVGSPYNRMDAFIYCNQMA